MAEYVEVPESELDQSAGQMLSCVTQGRPYVLLEIERLDSETFNIIMSRGGGISETETVRAMLQRTLRELP